jgi:iron complex outermembrane receptor protein
MSYRKSLLAASIVAGLCLSGALNAQDSSPTNDTTNTTQKQPDKVKQMAAVTVVGIRNSEAEALQLKQAAASHVEVVTAEDIGKLPAKNVADTLQRLPGVNISSSSASEGAFDEADRVSLRGTSPSMTQTTVNGHGVATGDWFVLSQVQTVGRSVSYSLLPSEIVSEVVVHKTSEASLLEGGATGSVDIITRKPLEFAKPVTGQVSVGGVYSDLPSSTKPQFSGMFNWKNDANTFGVMAQAFYESRSLQRNGQEIQSYEQIAPTDPVVATHPDLAGVYVPNEIGTAYFTQKRVRKGGSIDLEFKPTDDLTLNLDGFYSKLKADNYNRNYMTWQAQFVHANAPNPGYTVQNGVLTQATYPAVAGSATPYGVYDMISRPGASSKTSFVTLDADWRATDTLSFKFQGGTTSGTGSSPTQDVLELNTAQGAGASWQLNGTGSPADWNVGGNHSTPEGLVPGWIFGDQDIKVKDKENWFQADGEADFDGTLSSLQFGVRYADHTRKNSSDIGQGPTGDWAVGPYPSSYSTYPGNVDDIGGSYPTDIWYYTPGQLAQIDGQFTTRDPVTRFNWQNIYGVKEKDSAAYVQLNFEGDRWSGNVGVRAVKTKETVNFNTGSLQDYTVSGPFTGSAFGPYYKNRYEHTYTKFLPSANLKFNLTDDVVARFAASQTLTRPDYSALAGSIVLDDTTHAGSGGNPKLKPLLSSNFDAALEWYFAPRGLLSASVFSMQLKNYYTYATVTQSYVDQQATGTAPGAPLVYSDYRVSIPSNVDGSVKGAELDWVQPIGQNFGLEANYTYTDGEADGGLPMVGASKNTYNVSGFFENDKFNARVSYTYRSSFFDGVSHADTYYQAGVGNLALSLGYTINEWMSLSFDAMNLNNPKYKYYAVLDNGAKAPHAFYMNGRQYYLNLRFKF